MRKPPRAVGAGLSQGSHRHDLLQGKILVALSKAGLGMFWPHPTGMAFRDGEPVRYGLQGSTDIVGVSFGGYFTGIEVKTGAGFLRPNQEAFRDSVLRWGGIHIVGRSVEQAVADLAEELMRRGAEQGNLLEVLRDDRST